MKLRKLMAFFAVAAVMACLFAFCAYAEDTSVTGVTVWDTYDGVDTWSGANIILGTSGEAWPFAAGDAAAFTPEQDASYRLTFTVTSRGASGFRVRWIKDNENGSYTAGDAAVVNDHVKTADETATVIPAYFQNTIGIAETKTYTVEFKTDGAQNADELIGNIAIRGQQGNNDFSIKAIKIEKDGATLVDWSKGGKAAAAVASASESGNPVASLIYRILTVAFSEKSPFISRFNPYANFPRLFTAKLSVNGF